MKNSIKNLLLTTVPFYFLMADALASSCGGTKGPACEVPEPGTPLLFLGVAAVGALVVKFRNKK